MAKLCILAHPGKEHITDNPGYPKNVGFFVGVEIDDIKDASEGLMSWNTAPKHRRKFIKTEGECIDRDGNLYTHSDISFWGEWEQESYFIKAKKTDSESPDRIHFPRCVKTVVTDYLTGDGAIDEGFVSKNASFFTNKQNTDPYVFGDRFYYSCCRQEEKKENSEKSFLRLNKGDIILFVSTFGTKEKKDRICVLDTVFVIGGRVLPDKINYRSELNSLRKLVTPQYMNGVLLPICFGNRNSNNTVLNVLYHGQMYNGANSSEMFSFFPCRKDYGECGFGRYALYDEQNRCGIWYEERIVKGRAINGQHKAVTEMDDAELKAFWNYLKDDILKDGYLLGIKAYEPPFLDI